MNRKKIRFLTCGAAIAALYFALTLLSSLFGLSSGAIQCRLSEALCILPAFLPEAVPGLFLGCLLSNLLSGNIFDILIGSAATLIGAVGTRLLRRVRYRVLLPLPTVLANTIFIPAVLLLMAKTPFTPVAYLTFAATVCAGECLCALILGTLLDRLLLRSRLFSKEELWENFTPSKKKN